MGPTTEILIGTGVRAELRPRVDALGADRSVVALLDDPVAAAYPDLVPEGWRRIPLPGGESCKSFATLEKVLRQMAQWELDRRTIVVAIGGGAVGDLGGLAASMFLRGVDLIQVPTTLLAMLDSSVGGKTAINVPEGKNLVGTFHPAHLMLADLDFTASLPREQLLSGLGEALKMGIGFSTELFELLESESVSITSGDPQLLTRVVQMCVDEKQKTVEADPHETTGRRRCLNLGHTLAHALEAMSDYTMPHGHAVVQGLYFILDVAVATNTLAKDDADRCSRLLDLYGFTRQPTPPRSELLVFFSRDKKMESGMLHMVLPTAIGSCETRPMAPDAVCG
jgi:3-dehydroquinate synthetase